MLKIRKPEIGEWYPGQYAERSEAIAKLRREDPEYDKAWRDGLQRMADELDQKIAEKVYLSLHTEQRTGEEPV